MLQTRPEHPTAGLLAGDGASMMHLLAFTAPVPSEPPPDLAEHVQPVRDAKGRIRDWRFRATPFHPGEAPTAELTHYRRWRAGYVTERILGERACVLQFLDWADQHTDVSALHVLRLPQAHWELTPGIRAEEQVKRAAAACRVSRDRGLGIVAQPDTAHPHARLLRGFVTGDAPLLLLATPSASVTATEDRFVLEQAGVRHVISGWHCVDGEFTLVTEDGPVVLGHSAGARLLDRLAAGVRDVALNRVLLSSAFGLLFTNLAEMAHIATNARTTLWARVGGL